jgi:hypothetical protein
MTLYLRNRTLSEFLQIVYVTENYSQYRVSAVCQLLAMQQSYSSLYRQQWAIDKLQDPGGTQIARNAIRNSVYSKRRTFSTLVFYTAIPRCLRGEENNTPTLPSVDHVVVTICTTCSKNIQLVVKIFSVFSLITAL